MLFWARLSRDTLPPTPARPHSRMKGKEDFSLVSKFLKLAFNLHALIIFLTVVRLHRQEPKQPKSDKMNKERETKKDIIRAVKDGDMLTMPLSEVNYRAFVQRAYEINLEEGWRHYSISKSNLTNTLTIIAHKRHEDTGT